MNKLETIALDKLEQNIVDIAKDITDVHNDMRSPSTSDESQEELSEKFHKKLGYVIENTISNLKEANEVILALKNQ